MLQLDDLDKWAGSVVVISAAAAVIRKWVVRPMIRGFKRLGEMADQFLGDKDHPGVLARLARVETKVDEHGTVWHPPAPPLGNGGQAAPAAGRHHERR